MALILVDYENVNNLGLFGASYLNEQDKLVLFYSQYANKITEYNLKILRDSGSKLELVRLERQGKNGIDFYIASKIGYLAGLGTEKQIGIVSNDKGYQAVIDYWGLTGIDIRIVQGKDIARTLIQMNDKENKKRREMLNNEIKEIDIQIGCSSIIEEQTLKRKIEKILQEYEVNQDNVADSIEKSAKVGKRETYLSCLKLLGRKKGTELYKRIKSEI